MSAQKNPAPRGNAESRAMRIIHAAENKAFGPELEADFATVFLARRFGLAPSLARAVATLAGLGRAFV